MQTRPERIARKRRNDIHDQGINGNASHSSFINLDTIMSMPGCKYIIHDSGADEKTMRDFCFQKSPLERGLYPTLARRVTLTPPSIWAVFDYTLTNFVEHAEQFWGIAGNQCRKTRIVRNHIACAILV
jgi:hypothetical protein